MPHHKDPLNEILSRKESTSVPLSDPVLARSKWSPVEFFVELSDTSKRGNDFVHVELHWRHCSPLRRNVTARALFLGISVVSQLKGSASSSQEMYHKPTKGYEYHHSTPEYPLILLRPPLHHSYRITTDSQCIRHTVQFSLCPFQHLTLLAQITQHSAPTI